MGRALVLRTSVALAVGIGLAKVLVSCVDLDSLGSGAPDGQAPPEAGIDGEVPPAIADPCAHTQFPLTSVASDGKDELPTFVLALDTVTLDTTKVSALDLDGVCTCDTRPGARDDGGPRCATTNVTCDGDGGTDNQLGSVADLTASKVGIETISNREIATGHRTVLLQIQKYNGLANDDQVIVGTLVAEGIHSQGCPASVFDPAAQVWSAGRCGDDPWAISPASVVASAGNPALVVGTGYVRDFRLVVPRLNNPVLVPFNDGTTINFRLPVLTGQLVPLGEDLAPRDPARTPTEKEKRLFRVENGLLAGRVLSPEALVALGSYLPSSGTRLCASAGFGVIRDTICASSDIQGKPASPEIPSARCDALSGALGFVAIPAVTSFVSDAGAAPTGCESIDAAAFVCP